jgi:hypothetical protein
MNTAMLLDKVTRMVELLKDARSVTGRLFFLRDPRTTRQVILLQRLLDRIQTSLISMRADFIEMVFPDEPAQADDSGPVTVRFFRRSTAEERSGALPFDRRHRIPDRRQLHTYIANDRRSGIADRRRKKQKRDAPRVRAM